MKKVICLFLMCVALIAFVQYEYFDDQKNIEAIEQQARYWLEAARRDTFDASFNIDAFYEYAKKAKRDIAYFGTNKGELEKILGRCYVLKAKQWLEGARRCDSDSDCEVDFFRKYAKKAKKDLAYFGTSEDELAKICIKSHILQALYWLEGARQNPDDSYQIDFYFDNLTRAKKIWQKYDPTGEKSEELVEEIEKLFEEREISPKEILKEFLKEQKVPPSKLSNEQLNRVALFLYTFTFSS